MSSDAYTGLIEAALQVRRQAYAKYSQFAVGAALLTADGRIFLGCNVENASYGLTICAERSAVCAAVAAGQRKFTRLAIASDAGAAPCGACRQFLSEFSIDLPILLIDTQRNDATVEVSLHELFPLAFELRATGPG